MILSTMIIVHSISSLKIKKMSQDKKKSFLLYTRKLFNILIYVVDRENEINIWHFFFPRVIFVEKITELVKAFFSFFNVSLDAKGRLQIIIDPTVFFLQGK